MISLLWSFEKQRAVTTISQSLRSVSHCFTKNLNTRKKTPNIPYEQEIRMLSRIYRRAWKFKWILDRRRKFKDNSNVSSLYSWAYPVSLWDPLRWSCFWRKSRDWQWWDVARLGLLSSHIMQIHLATWWWWPVVAHGNKSYSIWSRSFACFWLHNS